MKRLILGSAMALLLMGGPAAATCTYQGVPYSEGARVCLHRTMFMCRGKRWVRTAERCWEQYSTQASPLQQAGQRPPGVLAQTNRNSPFVSVKIGEQRFDDVRVMPAPDRAEAVAEAMAKKYPLDLIIPWFPHPLTVWLEHGL